MITLKETKQNMLSDPQHWVIHLMDFVDDFRYYRAADALAEPFTLDHERFDALLASTTMRLCDELEVECPDWILKIPACRYPWFISGMESLKAIAIVESPVHFRLRKIFVLENFLSRA